MTVGYNHPVGLKYKLSKREAEASGAAYVIANYDAFGNLIKIEKNHNGRIDWVYDYTYDAQGDLVEVRVTNSNEEITRLKRDTKGKLKVVKY